MVLTDILFCWQNWVISLVGEAQGTKRNALLHAKVDSGQTGEQNTGFVLDSIHLPVKSAGNVTDQHNYYQKI